MVEVTNEEGAEEDEGDEVRNGNVKTASVGVLEVGQGVAVLATHARQHYQLPTLSCGASGSGGRLVVVNLV